MFAPMNQTNTSRNSSKASADGLCTMNIAIIALAIWLAIGCLIPCTTKAFKRCHEDRVAENAKIVTNFKEV